MRTIAVFGSSRREEESALYREAYELGRVLAGAGYAVLTGGYNGSMAAVSRGAAEAGGRVIGVTCAIFDPLP
ncbi:MAG: DNA-binding protein, partial [Anaerolineae bacterium]